MPYRDGFDSKGNHVLRIVYFKDANPYVPTAWAEYQAFVPTIFSSLNYYKTVGHDSATFLELAARKYDQYVANPVPAGDKERKHGLKWFGSAASSMEEAVWQHPANWQVNVFCVCHLETDKDEVGGFFVRSPFVRGKELRGKMGAAYQEIYRLYVQRDAQGVDHHLAQTRLDPSYLARSMIQAPNPVQTGLGYDGLWNGKAPWTPIHVLIYGEPGSGKTTLAATFPKSMLVLFWDPFGKDLPYIEYVINGGGTVTELFG